VEIDGIKHVVSDHARKRYRQRYEPQASDVRIITMCLHYPKAIWRFGGKGHPYDSDERVLVTVYPDDTGMVWEQHLKSVDPLDLIIPETESL